MVNKNKTSTKSQNLFFYVFKRNSLFFFYVIHMNFFQISLLHNFFFSLHWMKSRIFFFVVKVHIPLKKFPGDLMFW